MVNSVCVLGAGSTKYGKLSQSVIELGLDAAKGAIDSAGITQKISRQAISLMCLELRTNKYIWRLY